MPFVNKKKWGGGRHERWPYDHCKGKSAHLLCEVSDRSTWLIPDTNSRKELNVRESFSYPPMLKDHLSKNVLWRLSELSPFLWARRTELLSMSLRSWSRCCCGSGWSFGWCTGGIQPSRQVWTKKTHAHTQITTHTHWRRGQNTH